MTDDLSQCGNCIYHYTYKGRDMCKQVGDDFYLQWKVENCPYHTSITKVAAISDEIYRLKSENAALRERLERSIELPCIEPMTTYDWDDEKGIGEPHFGERFQLLYRDEDGEFIAYIGLDKEEAEAELAKLKGGNNER